LKASEIALDPFPKATSTTTNGSEDWMILDPLQWPDSPFGQSSLSSVGDSYAIQDDTWSPFEETFTDAQVLAQSTGSLDAAEDAYLNSPMSAYQAAFEINWSPEDLIPAYPWGNFASASKDEQMIEESKLEKIKTESVVESPIAGQSPTALTDPNPKVTRRSSEPTTKLAKTSKRMKKDDDYSPKASRTSKRTKQTSENPRLALTNKKHRSASSTSPSSAVSQDSRNSHNLIEKQYRNRLNLQFESLLETLPKEPVGEAGEKRVSKAEVLVHANEYIQELEEEMRALEEKNYGLEECVEGWKLRWSNSGGEAVTD